MRYGISWYTGVGENDYEESGREEYESVGDLLRDLHVRSAALVGEEFLFEALLSGPQEVIYWLTDYCGFAFYRPK